MKQNKKHPLCELAENDNFRFKAAVFLEMDGFLSPSLTSQIVSLSGSELHRLRKEGKFPEPETISGSRKGYRASAILAWLQHREDWNTQTERKAS